MAGTIDVLASDGAGLDGVSSVDAPPNLEDDATGGVEMADGVNESLSTLSVRDEMADGLAGVWRAAGAGEAREAFPRAVASLASLMASALSVN